MPPVGFRSGDEVSAVVDRPTHSGNDNGNGVVGFLRNWEGTGTGTAPVPIGFAEEDVLVISFGGGFVGGGARIVSFE